VSFDCFGEFLMRNEGFWEGTYGNEGGIWDVRIQDPSLRKAEVQDDSL
jgi:hypothetical protein